MEPLFKYLPSKYLDALVGRGELLFRSRSYFRNYEEAEVRGDRHEGRRLFSPKAGLDITKTETGEKLVLPWSFESSVKDRDILVFCLSTERSQVLAEEFNADACVEFTDPVALLSRVRSALKLRRWVKGGRLLHAAVDYYDPESPPMAEWAVPERMVMRKTLSYAHQREYRLAFARGNALHLNQVEPSITATPGAADSSLVEHPQYILKLGSLARLCKVHPSSEA